MSTTTDKIVERIAALPADEQDAVSADVLGYVDELVAVRAKLRDAEQDVAAGRVQPAEAVFARLLGKYAASS